MLLKVDQDIDPVPPRERAGGSSPVLLKSTSQVVRDPDIQGPRSIGQDVDVVVVDAHPTRISPVRPKVVILSTQVGAGSCRSLRSVVSPPTRAPLSGSFGASRPLRMTRRPKD